ncbi:hypothetical protein D3C75_490600 [compost metagenome]
MVVVDPAELGLAQQAAIDEAGIERHIGQPFEAQHGQLAHPLQLGHHHQVLAADTEAVFPVVTRFVGEHHARLQGHQAALGGDALRAFVHAEEVADPVACAMVVVVTGLPQGHAGQHVELDAGGAAGEAGLIQRDMALQHPGEHGLVLVGDFTDLDGTGDVGGAVQILGAGIHQVDAVLTEGARGAVGVTVVAHGGVGAERRYGVKARLDVVILLAAEGFQAIGQGALIHILIVTGGDKAIQPGQEAGNGDAVAQMGALHARQLHGVLARLGQHGRILPCHQDGARLFHGELGPGVGGVGVGQHLLLILADALQHVTQLVDGVDGDILPHVTGEGDAVDLVGVDEEIHAGVGVEHRKAQHHRQPLHVAAAQVEQPVDGLCLGQQHRIQPALAQVRRQQLALGLAGLARQLLAVEDDRGLGRGGAIAPVQIDGVLFDPNQRYAALGQYWLGALVPGEAVQAGIEADPGAGRQLICQPLDVGIFVQVKKLKQLGRCLHAGLHRITTVDEQGRPLRQYDGEAGGAVETRDPVQTFGIGGNVLPQVLVVVGNDEGVQFQRGQSGPDLGDAGFNNLEMIHVVIARL